MSSHASSSTSTPPQSTPTLLLFARGLIALLDLWPALTIAVREEWGGPDSPAKKTWIASTLLDEFESRLPILPNSNPPLIDPKSAEDTPLDQEEIGDLLNQMMTDEFEANVEDGSVDLVAGDVVRLWRDLIRPRGVGPVEVVGALERKAEEVGRKGVKAQKGGDLVEVDGEGDSGSEDGSGSGSEDEDEGMDVEEAPQLVPKDKERTEPVIDEEGFTMVQGKGRKGR